MGLPELPGPPLLTIIIQNTMSNFNTQIDINTDSFEYQQQLPYGFFTPEVEEEETEENTFTTL
jgi:hypothetical protein